jgi:hypothetical protein
MKKIIVSTISGIRKVMVKGKGWTPLGEVRPGDCVKVEGGEWKELEDNEWTISILEELSVREE